MMFNIDMVPVEFATAKEIGIAAATLGAMARRGLIEVQDGKPKRYRRNCGIIAKIYSLLELHKDKYGDYFILHREGEKLGMMCYLKSGHIVDCFGEPYAVENCDTISFRGTVFNLKDA